MYVLKGLSGDTSYESSSAGGAASLSASGISYADGKLTGATAPYVFKISTNGTGYSIQNTSTNSYLGSYNSYLYSRTSYSFSYCQWSLSINGNNVTATNSASSRYPYLSCYSSSGYFMMSSSAPTGLYFWKQSSGAASSYYTTVID